MTKKELVEALAEYPDEAIIDLRPPDQWHADDYEISGVVDVYASPLGMTWVTLGFTQ